MVNKLLIREHISIYLRAIKTAIIFHIKTFDFGRRLIISTKRILRMDQQYGVSFLNVAKEFPNYWPGSAGSYGSISKQAILAISETIPLLSSLTSRNHKIYSIEEFTSEFDSVNSQVLGDLFSHYGSDKSTSHDYHIVYAHILGVSTEIRSVFEIGLGTNNVKINSNMGSKGRPGASCRAFRDYLPNSVVYGADIDIASLFTEDRIYTFYLDQTDSDSFEALNGKIPENFSLMIDDGLHSINANLRSLKYFLTKLQRGGFAVIEDIPDWSIDFWHVVPSLLNKDFKTWLVKTKNSHLFVVERI